MTIRETRQSLAEYFEQLPDSRQQGKTLYPLAEIILTGVRAAGTEPALVIRDV